MGLAQEVRTMTAKKKKASKKAPTKVKAPAKEPKEELVVFAFRLTQAERDLIHKAAGPGKASKFVRTLTVAASKKDEKAVHEIVDRITAA
jgi:hypothetical protein